MPNGDETSGRIDPLSEADLDDVNRALKRLEQAEDLMQRSQQAGIDVEAFRVSARESKDRLLKIKQAFFPGR